MTIAGPNHEVCAGLDLARVPSPSFVVDLSRLRRNLIYLREVRERAGCRILLAQKGFSMWATYPLISEYLDGTCSSGPWEAMLAREKFPGEHHVYSPAFTAEDMDEILPFADHLSFNSVRQWQTYLPRIKAAGRTIECALRVNPGVSTGSVEMYDPCAPGSRLGIPAEELEGVDLTGLDGLHFHALCEQNSDALEATLTGVEEKFGHLLRQVKWLNMGGGHHITRADYDVERLISLVRGIRERYGIEVYLEPGEAVVLGTGVLVSSVIDTVRNGMDIGILDVSVTCHMPDCLEMPYRPDVRGAGREGEKPHLWRLGGGTCLAGDVIGDYSFEAPLQPGDRLIFEDMAHYTMVKTTMFNGVKHPALCTWDPEAGELKVVRRFDYTDFRDRLS
ncbi:MAG TPA: carboxynorspermidine decarboxylase [Verrucomicrobiales bacterium]|nr:carboxynorspermidine decarboxylase [Verrucomicrobiales bacterium]